MERLKRIFLLVLCLLTLCALFGFGTAAERSGEVCTLTVVYAGDGVPFEGLQIEIFRMGELNDEGVYTLAGDFRKYPVEISHVTTQAEWHTIADTLASYALTDRLTPTATRLTDQEGEADFGELPFGMYLVLAEQYQNGETVYLFENFLVVLPGVDGEGNPQYHIRAIPKHDQYTPSPQEIPYKVIKEWKDGDGRDRPDFVTVEIFRDGTLQYTQKLSSENNWSFAWTAPDDGAVWTVTEQDVPHGYTVTMEKNGETFVVTNHRIPDESSDSSDPPVTGDTEVLWPYVLGLFFAGAILAAVALRGRRIEA